MNKAKVDKLTIKDIPKEEIEAEVKKYLKNIRNWMGKQTEENLNWKRFSRRAEDLLFQIRAIKIAIERDNNSEQLKNIVEMNYGKKKSRELQSIKYIYTYQAILTKAYIFIEEFRRFLTDENMEYLILFDNQQNLKEQKIGKFTLKELLPTLNITVSNDKGFTLQINNVEELAKLKAKKQILTDQTQDYYTKIINLYNDLVKKSFEAGKKYFVFGGSFEAAARKLVDTIGTGDINKIEIGIKDFKIDTQAFYKAGDMTKEQAEKLFAGTEEIMKEGKSLALELKRINLSEGTLGARLTGDGTLELALEKIKKIINDKEGNSATIENNLKKMFSSKEDDILRNSLSSAAAVIVDSVNNIIT